MVKVDEFGDHWMQVIVADETKWRRVVRYELNDECGFSHMRPVPSTDPSEMVLDVLGGPPVVVVAKR